MHSNLCANRLIHLKNNVGPIGNAFALNYKSIRLLWSGLDQSLKHIILQIIMLFKILRQPAIVLGLFNYFLLVPLFET